MLTGANHQTTTTIKVEEEKISVALGSLRNTRETAQGCYAHTVIFFSPVHHSYTPSNHRQHVRRRRDTVDPPPTTPREPTTLRVSVIGFFPNMAYFFF
jgi:hypothetical protein